MPLNQFTTALRRLVTLTRTGRVNNQEEGSIDAATAAEQPDVHLAKFIAAWMNGLANVTPDAKQIVLIDGAAPAPENEKVVAGLESGRIDLRDLLEQVQEALNAGHIPLPPKAPIAIGNCAIEAWSDESGSTLGLPLAFIGCTFKNVILEDVVFTEHITFEDCRFNWYARFRQTKFKEGLRISSCRFPDATNFYAARIRSVFSISRTKFGDSCSFQFMYVEPDTTQTDREDDTVELPAGRVNREQVELLTGYRLTATANYVDISGCTFGKHANFRCATFGVMTQFSGTTFDDDVDFFNARFNGNTKFDRVQCYGFGNFNDIVVERKINFDQARLGLVDFGKLAGQRIDIANSSFAGRNHITNALWLFMRARSRGIARGKPRRGTSVSQWILFPFSWLFEVARAYGADGVGWKSVRGLAELKIFTRVSFAALVIVPLIATFWLAGNRLFMTTVRMGNSAVAGSEKRIESLRQELASLEGAGQLSARIKEDVSQLSAFLTRCRETIGEHQSMSAIGYWLVGHEVGNAVAGVDESIDQLQQELNDLSTKTKDSTTIDSAKKSVDASLQRILDGLKQVQAQLNSVENHTAYLPRSFAESFAAALALLIGQLIYQLEAPKLLKDADSEQFVLERKNRFTEQAADAKDQLARAADEINRLSERTYLKRHPNLLRRFGKTYWLPSIPECLFSKWSFESQTTSSVSAPARQLAVTDVQARRETTLDRVTSGEATPAHANGEPLVDGHGAAIHTVPADNPDAIYPDRERMIVMIEEGAKAEYEYANRSHPISSTATTALYLFALSLVAIALVRQTLVVCLAAGYEPLPWVKAIAEFLGAYPGI